MDQPLKSPLLATDIGCRFACWGVIICLFILTMPHSIGVVPLNHWRLVTLIGLDLICIAIMYQFKHAAATRDVIDLQAFEVLFFGSLLVFYFLKPDWYIKLSADLAKPFFIWVSGMQLLRLFWLCPNRLGSGYLEWPRFGLLGWLFKPEPELPRPTLIAKLAVLVAAIFVAGLSVWLANCSLPWPEYVMAGSGLTVIGIYARSTNNRVSKTIEQHIQTVAQIHFYQKMMNDAADYIEQLKTYLPPEVLASMRNNQAKEKRAPASHLKLVRKAPRQESE